MDEKVLNDIIAEVQPEVNVGDAESEPTKKRGRPKKEGVTIRAGDYVKGKGRFDTPIPASAISDTPDHKLYEIIDDWDGWRILVGENWEPIQALTYKGGNLVSVLAGGRVDAYDKDETPVLR